MDFKFGCSSKGKRTVIFQNFEYFKSRDNPWGTTWRCTYQQRMKCKATLKTSGNKVISNKQMVHNHPENVGRMKNSVVEITATPSLAHTRIMSQLSRIIRGHNAQNPLPAISNNKNKVKNGNGVSHDQQVPPIIYGINGGFHLKKEMSPDKSLKCTLCDFTTSVQEHLDKHMLIHAATENKDLCSIYAINSEALIENKTINGNSNGSELLHNAGVRVLENPRSVLFGPLIPLDLSNNANGREMQEPLESVVSFSATENELGDDKPASSSQSSPQGPQLMNGNEKNKVKEKNGNGRKDYECSHCGIIFKNDVMYSVHMGFHGFYDPFQCNICGEVTDDKIQFFLHIGRNAHLC